MPTNEGPAVWTAELAQRGQVVIPLRRGRLILRMGVLVAVAGTLGSAIVSAVMGWWSWSLQELLNQLGLLVSALLGMAVSISITWPRHLVVDATGIRLGPWRAHWADVERIDVRRQVLGFTSVLVRPRRRTASKRLRLLADQVRDLDGFADWLRSTAGAHGAPLEGGPQPLSPAGA
jgi:hypothetical protein